jgi:hypothetical protein
MGHRRLLMPAAISPPCCSVPWKIDRKRKYRRASFASAQTQIFGSVMLSFQQSPRSLMGSSSAHSRLHAGPFTAPTLLEREHCVP